MHLHVEPAYGRDYKSQKAVKADWDAGKDFRINQMGHPHDGRYINNAQKTPDMHIQVRYNSQRSVMVIQ